MSRNKFFYSLFLITGLTAAILFFLHRLPALQSSANISWISLSAFVLLSLGMYFMAESAAKSKNKNTFTSVVLMSTMVKMFLAILIIVVYIKVVAPDSRLFVLPFLGIYFIFTIFETYFMMKLGKTKSENEKQ